MLARQVERDVQVWQGHAVAALHRETHAAVVSSHIHCTHLRFFVEAIAGDGTRYLGQYAAHGGIVGAQNGRTVERHAVQELDERSLQLVEVMAIRVHVVGVDVGHHRHHGQEVQE